VSMAELDCGARKIAPMGRLKFKEFVDKFL
jgi:hypothetical protein